MQDVYSLQENLLFEKKNELRNRDTVLKQLF